MLAEDLVGAPAQAEVEATVPGGRRVSPRLHNDPLQRRRGGSVGEMELFPKQMWPRSSQLGP